MNLFEVNEAILNCIDQETGEVLDVEALNQLEIEKGAKIENLALWYKNLMADAEALKKEKDAFAQREKSAKNKADSIKRYLASVLNGEKFQTEKCLLSFRKSESVEILDKEAFMNSDTAENYLKYKAPDIDKAALKKALKAGETFRGVLLAENNNIQIK